MAGWMQVFKLAECCAVYWTLKLVRGLCFSFVCIALIMFFRHFLFSNRIFAKGMVWVLLLPAPFLGKLKLFYENDFVWNMTCRQTGCIMAFPWIRYGYMAGISVSFLYIFGKRIRLKRMISHMERRFAGGRQVFVTPMNITPFTAGLLRPKMVLPEVMMESSNLQTVICHEQTHIRLGHLWGYFVWDIFRCLFWLNPFLMLCQRYFRADMEEVCDKVCIQHSKKTVQEYGQVLLDTVRFLKAEQNPIASTATYAGEKDFEALKSRMKKIADFRPYKKGLCRGMVFATALLLGTALMGIGSISYARCENTDDILVYEYNPENGSNTVLGHGDQLKKMITYDEEYVYIDRNSFERFLHKKGAEQEVYIVFGGYQKLPGIGGGGYSCYYQADSDEAEVKIPYKKPEENWIAILFKLL